MDKRCKNCKHYTPGVTDQQRHEWSWSGLGRWADGVCNLYFPRGYIGREPPHPAMASGKCFQWEPQEENEQLTIFDLEE